MDSIALFSVSLVLLFATARGASAQFVGLNSSSRFRSLSQTPGDTSPGDSFGADAQSPQSGDFDLVVLDIDASALTNPEPCDVKTGVSYPRGNVLYRALAETDDYCCRLCRDVEADCFSWYRDARTDRCTLNKNIPNAVRRGGNFAGAALV